MTAPRLEPVLRENLVPVLRADGFTGSGRTYRRVVNDWIHVVNVQGSRYGGEFAINLAVHPLAVPDVLGNAADPKTITQELCEFRRRMAAPPDRDAWWKHDGTAPGMAAAVRQATTMYVHVGRAMLNDATAAHSDLNTVSAADFVAGRFNFHGFGLTTGCRMALVLAHLRQATGRSAEARGFAAHALQTAGPATAIKAQARALLAA